MAAARSGLPTCSAPTYDPQEDWDTGVRVYFEAAFGREHFAAMAAALMRPPLGTCLRVNPLRTTTQVGLTISRTKIMRCSMPSSAACSQ